LKKYLIAEGSSDSNGDDPG